MKVKVKLLLPNAKLPKKAHADDAGADLTCTKKWEDEFGNVVYGTGIAVEIPVGYVGLLFPRSSNAKKDLVLTNSVGVIDAGYRGEILFKFKRTAFLEHSIYPEEYEVGDRIGQLIIMPIPFVEYTEAEELSETGRGNGGYGSTGK